jgi:hypothetical protein
MEMLTAPAVLALTAKRAADAAKADPIVNVFIIRTPVVKFHISTPSFNRRSAVTWLLLPTLMFQ